MKIINNVNFNKKQLKNAVIEQLSAAPASPVQGQIYFNDGTVTASDKGFYIYDGTAWSELTDQSMSVQEIVTALEGYGAKVIIDVDLLDGQSGSHYLARANHTGQQAASTISDFDTQVRTNRLDQLAAPTGSVSLNNQKITGLATPTDNNDAANKSYVDGKVSDYAKGLDAKESVVVVATTNQTPSGLITIDGVALYPGARVLLTAQTTVAENGIYIAEPGSWSKASDATGANLTKGAYVLVESGTQAGSAWTYVGGAGEVWTKFSESTVINAGTGTTVTTVGKTSTIAVDTTVIPRKAVTTIGDGVATQFDLTHGFGTNDVVVGVREIATGEQVLASVTILNNATIRIIFDTAPASNSYGVVIVG